MYIPTRNKKHLRLAWICEDWGSHVECQGHCFLGREAMLSVTAFRNRELASTHFYIEEGVGSFLRNID
jgi:hypothetical protein